MPFRTIASFEFFNDGEYSSRADVIQWGEDKNWSAYNISLRSFYIGDGQERPTRNGVCLRQEEIRKLIPYLERGEEARLNFNKGGRTVSFRKQSNSDLFDIFLYKMSNEFRSENIKTMTLSRDSLKGLCSIKEKFLPFCPIDA